MILISLVESELSEFIYLHRFFSVMTRLDGSEVSPLIGLYYDVQHSDKLRDVSYHISLIYIIIFNILTGLRGSELSQLVHLCRNFNILKGFSEFELSQCVKLYCGLQHSDRPQGI